VVEDGQVVVYADPADLPAVPINNTKVQALRPNI